jgi:hypothetical protein
VPDCFAAVPDPRGRRGRRHSLPSVLTLVLMAVLRGRTTLAGITTWIAHASQDQLAAAGARTGACGQRQPPSGRTVTRLLGMAGGRPLAEAVACYLAAAEAAEPPAYPVAGPALQPHLACDGKEVRGAVRPDGTSLFLLSAATGGIVVADREIPAKTSEIPEIGPMLLELDQRFPLAGWVLTADALCGRPHKASAEMTASFRSSAGILSRRSRKTGISFSFFVFTGSWAAVVPSSQRPDNSIGAVPPRAAPRSAFPSTRRCLRMPGRRSRARAAAQAHRTSSACRAWTGSPRTRENVAASGRRGCPAASRGAPSRYRIRADAAAAQAAAASGLSSPAAPAATAIAVR